MSVFILMHFMCHDREGILPVNTFTTSTAPDKNFVNKVNYHLSELLPKFFNTPLPDAFFWVTPEGEFNPEEQEGYGYVYAEQKHNDSLPLSTDPYKAAVNLVKYIIDDVVKNQEIVDNSVYPLNGYKISNLPTVAPVVDETVPVDPRFTKGEIVVDSFGNKLTYQGVTHYPLNPNHASTAHEPDYRNKTVKFGVQHKGYVAERKITDFLTNNKITVYPLPSIAKRHLPKGTKWFALSADGKKEGYGKTQKEAKEKLAYEILV